MEECVSWIGRLPWLNRGDVGFCSEQIMAWHEQDNKPHYLFKLRLTKNLKRAIAQGTSLIKSNSLKCIILNFMLVTFEIHF